VWLTIRAETAQHALGRLELPNLSSTATLGCASAVLITGFPSEVTATNCWIVAPAAGEQCIVIDPGIGVGGQLDEVIAEHRLHPVAVLLTHGHIDHTFSVVPV